MLSAFFKIHIDNQKYIWQNIIYRSIFQKEVIYDRADKSLCIVANRK